MSSPITRKRFAEAASRIASWQRPLLVSHVKPDGDALGSLMAMRLWLRSGRADGRSGAEPTVLLYDQVPSRYDSLIGGSGVAILGNDFTESDLNRVDGVIVLDTCAYSQLDPIAEWLRTSKQPKLVVDHHVTRDELADLYLIDESAAATSLILLDWARAVGWPIEPRIAEALLVGIATDTGWFHHSNTDARALAAASELTACGAHLYQLYEHLYQCESPGRLRLLAAALDSMELLAGDRLAVLTLPSAVFKRTGATREETEGIINEPLRIGSVVVSVLLVEQEDGTVRASFRSRAGHPPQVPGGAQTCGQDDRLAAGGTPDTSWGEPDIDVAAIAQSFGGGGHRRAAGARMNGNLAWAYRAVIERVQPCLSPAASASPAASVPPAASP